MKKKKQMTPKPVAATPFGKRAISIRIDGAIIDYFKSLGSHYQSRMNDVLRKYMERNQ